MAGRTIAVIGATGRTGRHIVAGLLERGASVRALVRRPSTAGLPDPVIMTEGSLEDADALAETVRGADAAFLLWPGFDSTGADRVVETLAAQVRHIVCLSAAQLQRGSAFGEVMPGVWAEVEQAIASTDATWTFVRGGGFAVNTLEWADQIRSGDTVRIPYPDAGRSLVHERDLADVSVRALVDDDLIGAAVAVTGPQTLTQREQVAAIGAAVGRELQVEEKPADEARADYAAMMGPEFAEQALRHWAGLVDDPEQVSDDVSKIIGRPARSFAEWADDHAVDFAHRG